MNPRAAINDLLPFQGSPFGQLGYFSKLIDLRLTIFITENHRRCRLVVSKRRGWDSNPRALADKRFSRPPRYDHFDTPARERVMGIEPTYPAWKAGVLPLNYTRIFNCSQVGVTGFEPATSWSQTRRSSQAEPHPDMLFCCFVFVASPKRLRYNITLFHTCQHFFTFF